MSLWGWFSFKPHKLLAFPLLSQDLVFMKWQYFYTEKSRHTCQWQFLQIVFTLWLQLNGSMFTTISLAEISLDGPKTDLVPSLQSDRQCFPQSIWKDSLPAFWFIFIMCMHVCLCVCVFDHMYLCLSMCMCIWLCVFMFPHVYVYLLMYKFTWEPSQWKPEEGTGSLGAGVMVSCGIDTHNCGFWELNLGLLQ